MRWKLFAVLAGLLHKLAPAQTIPYSLPLNSIQLSSSYGPRFHPIKGRAAFHCGVDLKAKAEPVYAILTGIVVKAGSDEGLGRFLIIDHGGIQSIYGHLSCQLVSERKAVVAGELIGITGSSGKVTGEHLHFAIRCNYRYINPLRFLLGLGDHQIQ